MPTEQQDKLTIIEGLRRIADQVEVAGGIPAHVRRFVLSVFDGRTEYGPPPAIVRWYNHEVHGGDRDTATTLSTAIAALGGILSNGNRPFDPDWPRQLRAAASVLKKTTGPDQKLLPSDTVRLSVVTTYYCVSQETLKRMIKAGVLVSFRNKPNGPHVVSLSEVAKLNIPRRLETAAK